MHNRLSHASGAIARAQDGDSESTAQGTRVLALGRYSLARLVAVVVLAASSPHAPPAHAAARFCTSTSVFSFGDVAVGSSASATATVGNCGDQPYTFSDVSVHPQTGPAFSVTTDCATGMTLAPASTCAVNVMFAPMASGQTSGGVWLGNSASGTKPLLAFYGRGVDSRAGTASIAFLPSSAMFGPQQVDTQSPAMSIAVHNAGPAALTLSNIVLGGADAYDFLGLQQTCTVGGTIAAGDSCLLSLYFVPTATGGREADIAIDSPQLAALAILPLGGIGIRATLPAIVSVVEYYDAAFDHYFMTPVASEIALCDARQPPCADWVRTGRSFNAYAITGAPAASAAVCRFFNDSFAPRSSHFYALHGLGCEQTLAAFPDWQLEYSALFNALLPATDGSCAAGAVPVYRVYNNGMGGAPNHRFTTDFAVRAQMIAAGWVAEGNGIGVAFCAAP
ncbi:MAG: choice-of-anchor D domain-containing protein [Casimicrobiaceae bacterium]